MIKLLIKEGFFHHKNAIGFRKILDYSNIILVSSIEEADIIYSPSNPIDVIKYPMKKFIFGPHFSVFPDHKVMSLNNKYNNIYYIMPSKWPCDLWINEFKIKNIPIISAAFPVDINKFKPNNLIKNKILIYFKSRKEEDLDFVLNFCKGEDLDFILFVYGKYKEDDYIKALDICKYGIWVGRHESQGFALEEALSCNVPLIVWDATSMSQEVGSNYNHIKTKSTTIPYWDKRCGEYFTRKEELSEVYNFFISKLNDYKPREYILENLSTEICYDKYWKILLHVENNIVIITSVVDTPLKPLSYTPVRSIYTKIERFDQTKKTIQSVKEKIPFLKIILIECSKLTEEEEMFFNENVDVFINLYNDKESRDCVYSLSKSLGESTQILHAIKYILDKNISCNNLFKISGRYYLNDDFRYNMFNNFRTCVYPIQNNMNNINTSFYKLSGQKIIEYYEFLKKSKQLFSENVGLEIIFSKFIGKMDKDEMIILDKIGLTGNVSVCGTFFNV